MDEHEEILGLIKAKLPEIDAMLAEVSGHWGYEDGLYRFWHQSFKVYWIQEYTTSIVKLLESLAPEGLVLHPWLLKIVQEGTGHKFDLSHNENWLQHTRPIVEAFLHCKYFLEMASKYGHELDSAPTIMGSGWAAVTSIYVRQRRDPRIGASG